MQRAFVEAYASVPNSKAAAIKAGYSPKSARQQGTYLRALPAVIEALQARSQAALERLQVTEDLVLSELAAIAFSNIKRFTTWSADGELIVKDSEDIPDALACAIESVEEQTLTSTNKDGSRNYTRVKRRVKLYSKLDALGKLAEYLGISDNLAPKIDIHINTGIDRTPKPVTIEAEPVSGD